MREPSFLDEFTKGFGDAIADIREKVVEEPWFGRVVTERGESSPQWPEAHEPQQIEPEGLTGDIFPPESMAAREASSSLRIEHGTVLEGQAERTQWPQARDVEAIDTHESINQNHEHEQQQDIDR